MKRCYTAKKFQGTTKDMILLADKIIQNYQAQGYDLSLRQIYYHFVSNNLFPEDRRWKLVGRKWIRDENGTKNAEPNYKWLGGLISDGRLAGLLSWDAIEDRGRYVRSSSTWKGPSEIVRACASQFRLDWWEGQTYRPQIWVEKEALIGVVSKPCKRLQVPYFACKGYPSQSSLWNEAQRFRRLQEEGYEPIIIHLGDHDPSGIDMTRDMDDRLNLFLEGDGGNAINVIRIALNWDQIQKYDPPPDPAKLTDSRAKGYVERFGYESWELDSLKPEVLDQLITDAVLQYRDDDDAYAAVREQERVHRELLTAVSKELEVE